MQTQVKQSDTGTEATAPKLRNYVDGAWVTPQTDNVPGRDEPGHRRNYCAGTDLH